MADERMSHAHSCARRDFPEKCWSGLTAGAL